MSTNCYVEELLDSQRCFSSVAYVWRSLHHSTTRYCTTEHKLALPKFLNNMAFNPSLKRVGYETLASIKLRTLVNNKYKYSNNNKIRYVSPDTSMAPLETNKPLSDRGLRE